MWFPPKDPLIVGNPPIEFDGAPGSAARLLPPPPPPPMEPMASNKSAGAPPPIAPHQPSQPPPPHLQRAGGRPSRTTPLQTKAAPSAKAEEEQQQAEADAILGGALKGARATGPASHRASYGGARGAQRRRAGGHAAAKRHMCSFGTNRE